MSSLRWLLIFAILGFTAALTWAFVAGEFWAESGQITSLIWGKVMLADLYIGLLIVAIMIWVLEKSRMSAVLWVALVLILGNVASLGYFLLRFNRVKSFLNGDFNG